MTQRFALLLVLLSVGAAGASGCLVVRDRRGPGRPVYVAPGPQCHPSEYWDGDSCRHKGGHGHGRGRGHDKDHDGRGRGRHGGHDRH